MGPLVALLARDIYTGHVFLLFSSEKYGVVGERRKTARREPWVS